MRFVKTIRMLIWCLLVSQGVVAFTQSSTVVGGGSQVIAYSLSNFKNAISSAMGNTSLSALYNQLSFVNNIAQLPMSNKTGGIALSYTPMLSNLPLGNSSLFQMTLEGYYIFGENYYQPSTEKLAAIYECYKVGASRLRDVRGRVLSIKKNGYVLRRQALSLKTSYYSRGSIVGRDENASSIGEASPFEFNLALGYSVNMWDNFSIGVALRYLNSTLYTASKVNPISSTYSLQPISSNAFSGDLYLFYDIPFRDHERGGVSLGMILGNIGTKVNFDNGISGYQPAYADLGVSFTNIFSPEHSFHYTFDFKKSLVHSLPSTDLLTSENLKRYASLSVGQSMVNSLGDFSNYSLNLGGRYIYRETLSLLAGFEWNKTTYESIYRASVGLGITYQNRFNINFAYWIPFGESSLSQYTSSWSLSASMEF